MQLFHLHRKENKVYKEFIDQFSPNQIEPNTATDLPLLPVELFKTQNVLLNQSHPISHFFESSSTSGTGISTHKIADLALYDKSLQAGFEYAFGRPNQYIFLGLLPGYLERPHASLVYMVEQLMKVSNHPLNGFYLQHNKELIQLLSSPPPEGRQYFLWGVTFALLDLIPHFSTSALNKDLIVLETGGMKGKRAEMVKEELHQTLKHSYGVKEIYSEYGMTELLSQAYSKGKRFTPPPWMTISIRREDNPLEVCTNGKTGRIGIIDLANYHSCPFLLTSDLGRQYDDGTFEVLGRADHSDVRGCSQMI